eukprot:375909-Prymnesium_polylepis.1
MPPTAAARAFARFLDSFRFCCFGWSFFKPTSGARSPRLAALAASADGVERSVVVSEPSCRACVPDGAICVR